MNEKKLTGQQLKYVLDLHDLDNSSMFGDVSLDECLGIFARLLEKQPKTGRRAAIAAQKARKNAENE